MTSNDIASTWFDAGHPARKPGNLIRAYGGRDARIRVIPILRKKDQTDPNGFYFNPTSSGKEGQDLFSPLYLGPCKLYGSLKAKKMESAWQYSKVYPQHVGTDGEPTAEYFKWAKRGWSSPFAKRYPMGDKLDGAEAYHWWNGQRLNKIEARKRIYVPLYAEQVVKLQNFKILKNIWEEEIKPDSENTMYLMDFDAYDYGTMTFSEVLNNPAKSMGHGFVLAMLLTDDAALRECELRTPL